MKIEDGFLANSVNFFSRIWKKFRAEDEVQLRRIREATPRRSLSVMLKIQCSHCGEYLSANHASEYFVCTSCRKLVATPDIMWQRLVTPHLFQADQFAPEEEEWAVGALAGLGSYRLDFGNLKPSCPVCDSRFDLNQLFQLSDEQNLLNCPQCNTPFVVRRPPPWFSRVMPSVQWLVGETQADPSTQGSEEDRESSDSEDPSRWYILIDTGKCSDFIPYNVDDVLDIAALPEGDTLILYKDYPDFFLARANQENTVNWTSVTLDISEQSRLAFDAKNQNVWIIDFESHNVLYLDAKTGSLIREIKSHAEKEDIITGKHHNGFAACDDGTIVVKRRWGENANPPRKLIIDTKKGRMYSKYKDTDPYKLRRFNEEGIRVPLWAGYHDLELKNGGIRSDGEIHDRPLEIPDETLITSGPHSTLFLLFSKERKLVQLDRSGNIIASREIQISKDSKRYWIYDLAADDRGTFFLLVEHPDAIVGVKYTHLAKIGPDGSLELLAGPHSIKNPTDIGSAREKLSIAEDGQLHLCGEDLYNFRILDSSGKELWKSFKTSLGDERQKEELKEARVQEAKRRPKKAKRS